MKLNEVKTAIPLLAKAEIVPLLIGESGVGKTESVRQVAQELGYRFINIRLGQLADSGDLTGLPEFTEVQNDDGSMVKVTAFMQPAFFPKSGEKAMVFFDEINRCHPDLIQAVFQAIERQGGIGEYKFDFTVDSETGLPNTIRVAASNPPTDDYVVHDITDKAFLNRFCHIKFEPTADEAFDYFKEIGVSPAIRAFLVDQPTMLEVAGEDYTLGYVKPTRRTWEAVNRFLALPEASDSLKREVMMGLVGSEATIAYESFAKNYDITVKGADILDNYEAVKDKVPTDRVDVLKKTNDEILDELKADNLTAKRTDNMMKYLVEIPKDVAAALLYDIATGKKDEDTLICQVPSVKEYFSTLDFNDSKYAFFKDVFNGVMNEEQQKNLGNEEDEK